MEAACNRTYSVSYLARLQEAADMSLEHGGTTGTTNREPLFLRLSIIKEEPDLPEQKSDPGFIYPSTGIASTASPTIDH